MLRFVHTKPLFAIGAGGEDFSGGYHISNSEIGGEASVRVTTLLYRHHTTTTALGPFPGRGPLAHTGKDFAKRLKRDLRQRPDRQPGRPTYWHAACSGSWIRPLELGEGEKQREETARRPVPVAAPPEHPAGSGPADHPGHDELRQRASRAAAPRTFPAAVGPDVVRPLQYTHTGVARPGHDRDGGCRAGGLSDPARTGQRQEDNMMATATKTGGRRRTKKDPVVPTRDEVIAKVRKLGGEHEVKRYEDIEAAREDPRPARRAASLEDRQHPEGEREGERRGDSHPPLLGRVSSGRTQRCGSPCGSPRRTSCRRSRRCSTKRGTRATS